MPSATTGCSTIRKVEMKSAMTVFDSSPIAGTSDWETTWSTSESTALPRSALWRLRNQA